eukprot:764346-Hanusia_phi.AAC.6
MKSLESAAPAVELIRCRCGGAFISLLKVFTTITTILLLFFMWSGGWQQGVTRGVVDGRYRQQMELALEGEDAQQRLIDRDHRIVADFRLARQTFFQRLMRTVRSNWFTWSILFPLNMIHPVPGHPPASITDSLNESL